MFEEALYLICLDIFELQKNTFFKILYYLRVLVFNIFNKLNLFKSFMILSPNK